VPQAAPPHIQFFINGAQVATDNQSNVSAVQPLGNRPVQQYANEANIAAGSSNGIQPGYFDNFDPSTVRYPHVMTVFEEIDATHEFDYLEFPTTIFAESLRAYQITLVDQVALVDIQFFIDVIGMDKELALRFGQRSAVAAYRAEKGKAKEVN
jgi:hypothetical protein